MKTWLPLFCLSVVLANGFTNVASSQDYFDPGFGENLPDGFSNGVGNTNGVDNQGGFASQLQVPFPGRAWMSYTGVPEGLGYGTGGYLTLGGKTRLGEDIFDGRWLVEAKGHFAHEQGQFFMNVGVERVFTIDPANADVGFSIWYDADFAHERDFGHSFYQIGIGGYIRHERYELAFNGYIPVGESGYQLGNPDNCFFDNYIVLQTGIDTAMQGFDGEIRLRPEFLAMWQGSFDFGMYYYSDPDELVDDLYGVRLRTSAQLFNGVRGEFEYNYDQRFDDTMFFRVVISTQVFGDYDPLGRDLDPTIRNDHVVRDNREIEFAVDPDTGSRYIVRHVDNTAGSGGDGTFERPFDALADVDPLQGGFSATDDIIFVREGDGTITNYDTGITLQDGQLFLGDGVAHVIPLRGGGTFELCNDQDGIKPVITAPNGADIVTLANRNTVAGFIIDGDDPSANGIVGVDVSGDTVIRDNMFRNLTTDAIRIDTIDDSLIVKDNMFENIGDDAVEITDVLSVGDTFLFSGNTIGTAANGIGDTAIRIDFFNAENTFVFDSNVITNTGTATAVGGDGIELSNGFDTVTGVGGSFFFTTNTITDAGGHGISVNSVTDPEAVFFFDSNVVTRSGQDGIHFFEYDGTDFVFTGNTTSANVCNGVLMEDYLGVGGNFDFLSHVANLNSEDGIFIDTADGDFDFIDSQIGDLDLTDGTLGNEGNGIHLFNVTTLTKGSGILIDRSSALATSILQGNGRGSEAGVRIELDADVPLNIVQADLDAFVADGGQVVPDLTTFHFANALITNSTINANGVGVLGIARGDAALQDSAVLNLGINENLAISNHRKDAINVQSWAGGAVDLEVIDNPAILNNGVDVGTGIRLLVFDETETGTGPLTQLTTLIQNNTITGTGGDGSSAGITVAAGGLPRFSLGGFILPGNANIDVRIRDNTLSGGGGDIINFDLDINNALINTIAISDNSITAGANSIDIIATNTTHVDMIVTNNDVQNPGGDAEGFRLNLFDDTRGRLLLADNTFVDEDFSSGNGIELFTFGTSRLFADVLGNSVDGFGFSGNAPNAAGIHQLANIRDNIIDLDLPDDFYARGIVIAAFDDTNIAANVINNDTMNTALEGIGIFSGGVPPVDRREFANNAFGLPNSNILAPVPNPASTANVDVVVLNNNITNADQARVQDTSPGATVKFPGRVGFRAETNGTASTMCLALDNNYSQQPYLVREEDSGGFGVDSTMRFEDGNNFGQLDEVHEDLPPGSQPSISFAPPSDHVIFDESNSTCITNVAAERLLFLSTFGFPSP